MKQIPLFPNPPRYHGGSLILGKRKSRRPLSRKDPVHFTLKANVNLFQHRKLIVHELVRLARKFGLKVFDLAVSSDHLHFVARIPSREQYRAFIRTFTGLIARKLGRGLWRLLPFTRVGHWGRDFQRMRSYCTQNREETLGHRAYEPRKNFYSKPQPS